MIEQRIVRIKEVRFKVITIILGIGILTGVYMGVIHPILTKHYLNKNSRYAITSNLEVSTRGSRTGAYLLNYYFSIGGKYYRGETNINLHKQHYFVKFYPPRPSYNKITYIEASEKDIDSMPPEGYERLPHQ